MGERGVTELAALCAESLATVDAWEAGQTS